ncbi:MAG: fimbria/pilus periplasmic chaperone [Desulfobulbaceae bacterium]|nr:fimbria/pilus periplasmic chaperone [Desulfobulbaceae bacterium]HIJ79203.1 molecular chaperone [Deltaproteobacteria bacterium]
MAISTVGMPELVKAAKHGVMVSPQRVIFEGRNRSAQIRVVNSSDQPCKFRVELVHIAMDATGRMREIKEPLAAQKNVEKMLRFSPRQISLKPKEAQTIRLMARRPAGVVDGEYRVHLSLVPVPPDPSSSDALEAEQVEKKTSVNIDMMIGVTLPVFIRFGDLAAGVTASNLVLHEGENPFVNLDLNRTGNCSVATDIELYLSSPAGGDETRVGRVSGAAVYYPALLRTVKIPLSVPAGFRFAGKRLKAVLKDHEDTNHPVFSSKIFAFRE